MSTEAAAIGEAGEGRWVGFRVAGQSYALDILSVQEVLDAVRIEPVPGAPPAVLGVINLRGRIVTVIDPRRCLGFDAAQAAEDENCAVVVAESGGETLGLRVDGVAEVYRVAEAAIKPAPPTRGRSANPLVRGIVNRAGLLLTLLDAGQLTAAAAAA